MFFININYVITGLKELSQLNWKEKVSTNWQGKKVENQTHLFDPHPIIEEIKLLIKENLSLLNHKDCVDSLLKIEFQAEQVGVDIQDLHSLILRAPSSCLDEITIEERQPDNRMKKRW